MSIQRFPGCPAHRREPLRSNAGFARQPAAKRRPDDDWEECEPGPDDEELWDPDTLDDDEPEPEPGDFWLDSDDE